MAKNVKEIAIPDQELDWVQMRHDFANAHPETFQEKFVRKVKENPLVPIGCLATAGALTYGLYSFRKGDRRMSQLMMRTRIAAQGFTLFALIGGVLYAYGGKNN